MNYRIDPIDKEEDRLTLRRSRALQVFMVLLLALIGVPALVVGLALFAAAGDRYGPFFFTGFGLLFLSGAVILAVRLRIPDAIVFDNAAGVMTVREGRGAGQAAAAIPYSEIAGFSVLGGVAGKKSGFSVVMAKKDGALWTLYSSSRQKRAGAFLESISTNVRIDREGAAPPRRGGSRFTVEEGRGVTVIRWRDRHPLRGSFLFFIVISSMGMTLFGSWPWITNVVVYGVAVVFIGAVMLLFLYNTVYSIGKTRRVTVTGGDLGYEERGGPLGGKGFTVPLAEIAAILFNFSITREDSVIYVVRKGEMEFFRKIARGELSPGDIIGALGLMMGIKKINALDLSTVEKMELEGLIQKALLERAGAGGL